MGRLAGEALGLQVIEGGFDVVGPEGNMLHSYILEVVGVYKYALVKALQRQPSSGRVMRYMFGPTH